MRDKVMFWGSMIILGSAFVMLGVLIFWSVFPYNVIDFTVPIAVTNPDYMVTRGDKLYLETTYDKHIDRNGHGESFIICDDGNLVTVLPPRIVGVSFPLGEHTLPFDITVPEKTSLGTCHFESTIEYQINPIRTIDYYIYTEDFEVIK